MTELDTYLVKLVGGGLVIKIVWDWLKIRKASSNGTVNVSQKSCDERQKLVDERHADITGDISSIKGHVEKLFDQTKDTGECVARIEGYLKK